MISRRFQIAFALALLAGCDQLVTKPSRYTAVEVETVRRDGSPVAGVPLTLYTGQRPMGYATSDSSGHARFERVPEGPVYGVLAEPPPGYALPEQLLGGPSSNVVQGFPLSHDSVKTVRFIFLRIGPGTITARVTDPTGAPIANVEVELYSPAAVIQKAKTASDGSVTFRDIPFGVYGIAVVRPDGYRDVGESDRVTRDGLLVEQGSTSTSAVTLTPCSGTIAVRTADATRGPAAGIRVYKYRSTGIVDSARTDASGRALFATGCGEFGVFIASSNPDWLVIPGRGSQYLDGLVVRRGSAVSVELPVTFNSCRGAIAVTVTDPAGTVVPGASVTMYDALGNSVTAAAPNGQVSFTDLACGVERGVRVTAPAGWTTSGARGSSYLDALQVTNGGTLQVRLVVQRP